MGDKLKMDDNETRFDILEKVEEAEEEFNQKMDKEEERWRNRRERHRKKENQIKDDYKDTLDDIAQIREIKELLQLQDQIEELNLKKRELMDEVQEVFYLGLNSFVDGKRVTGDRKITIKDNGVHRYGHRKNSKLSLRSTLRCEDALKSAMKKTDHYEEFLEMWETIQEMDTSTSFNISKHIELNPEVKFLDTSRKYVEYTANKPHRIDILEAETFEEGEYSRSKDSFRIDQDNLGNVSQLNHGSTEPQNLKAALRFHDKIKQVMEQTREDCKQSLQKQKDLKRELAKPAQRYITIHKL